MTFSSATEGRECDALVQAPVYSRFIPVDGANVSFRVGDAVKFQIGAVRSVVSFDAGFLVVDQPVNAPDNCGVWLA